MNINQYTGFFRWMIKSFGHSIVRKHSEYRDLMDREFWLSFVLWVILTGIIIIPVGITATYFFAPGTGHIQTVLQIYLGTSIAYFVGTGVSIMYENYCAEQERIIERLKSRG